METGFTSRSPKGAARGLSGTTIPPLPLGGFRFTWSLEDQVALAKQLFPFKKATQWNLTVSNKERIEINARMMKKGYKRSKEQGLWMPASIKPTACEAQEYWLCPGLILIAYLPRGVAKDCHNGELFSGARVRGRRDPKRH